MQIDLTVGGYCIHNHKLLLIFNPKYKGWYPIGGHIKENETPNETLKRKIKSEANLEISRIISPLDRIPTEGNIIEQLAIPFDVDIHKAADHQHVGFFYVCEIANPDALVPNPEDMSDYKWLSKEELEKDETVSVEVRNRGKKALEIWEENYSSG